MSERPTFPERFNLADYYVFDRLTEGLGPKIAVRFGDRAYSYDDIADRTRLVRAHFALAGVPREARVLIALRDSPAFVWAFFATLHHGAVVAMGNPDAPAEDLEYLLDYTGAEALVTCPRVAAALAEPIARSARLRTVLVVPEDDTGHDVEAPLTLPDVRGAVGLRDALAAARRADVAGPSPTARDELAIWLFTSGSTGRSKAAMHTHRDFAFNTEVYAKRTVGYARDDVTVSVPRLFFGYATGTNLMFPFAVGATTALFSERPTPESLAWAIATYRPTVVTNVPTMMGKLLEHDRDLVKAGQAPLDFSCVRFHLSAGEALPQALMERFTERFGAEVYDGIGSAEMFHIYASNRPGDIKPGSLGRVVAGYEIAVLPSDASTPGAAPLPPGETGVLWVRGDSIALGYHRDRDRSWATFHGAWCRTGDLFRIDADGYLWFSGRADDLLKVGGVWVAPVEVEECLLKHASVAAAAVIGVLEDGLTKPMAFVVLRSHADACDELATTLKEHVKARLSKHKYPRTIAFVVDLPKNDRGKVDRKRLESLAATATGPKVS